MHICYEGLCAARAETLTESKHKHAAAAGHQKLSARARRNIIVVSLCHPVFAEPKKLNTQEKINCSRQLMIVSSPGDEEDTERHKC